MKSCAIDHLDADMAGNRARIPQDGPGDGLWWYGSPELSIILNRLLCARPLGYSFQYMPGHINPDKNQCKCMIDRYLVKVMSAKLSYVNLLSEYT